MGRLGTRSVGGAYRGEIGTSRMKFLALLKEAATDPRLALMLPLGFSSGLPFLLIFSTPSAWLSAAHAAPHQISLMSWCLMAFSFKFAWAPVIDRFNLPVLSRWLGRRRSWMLLAQMGIAAGLVGYSFSDPARGLAWSAVCASFVGFAAATQDITIDAWRIDAAPPERQGVMVGVYSVGYRVAIFAAGAGALYLSDLIGWRGTYLIMAALTVVGMVGCLMAPNIDAGRQRTADRASTVAVEAVERFSLRVSALPGGAAMAAVARLYGPPLYDLIRRYGASLAAILLLVAFYRMPDFLSGVMATPLYKHLGYANSEIATASKVLGVWVSIAGTLAGGACVVRFGLMPALLIGGIAAPAAHLSFVWLAAQPHQLSALIVAVCCDNLATGFAGAALIAYMSSLVSPAHAAMQYALLSSLYAFPGKFVGGFSGYLVEDWGYPRYFATSATIGVPIALLCLAVWRLQAAAPAVEKPAAAS